MSSIETAKLISSAVILRDGKVLIFEEKTDDGVVKYNLPGGHVDVGETPLEAVVREVLEETGLVARPRDFLQLVVNTWSKNHSVLMYFLVDVEDGDVTLEEGITAVWMNESEVAALVDEQCVYGVKEAVQKVFVGSVVSANSFLVRKRGENIVWK